MEYVSTQRYLIMSPRKMRMVLPAIKGLSPEKAAVVLPHIQKRAAEPIMKAIKTAMANATQAGANPSELVFKSIEIGEGPRLKRYRAGSRGTARPYVKRMSHIRVVLETKKAEAPKVKSKVKSLAKKTDEPEKGGSQKG